ncbi:hypothetical protein D3C76_1003100 [compost metagenome]
MRLAAGNHASAFAHSVFNVLLNLGHGFGVDQGAGGDAVFQAITNVQLGHGRGELVDEGIVDAVLDIQTVGADAGLAVVAVLRDQRPLDSGVQVGVIEDDEGCIAAQFQRHLLDVLGALDHQPAADFGGAGEGQLAHERVTGQLAADFAGTAGDHAEHAFRNAGALGQLGQGQGRVRRLRGRLEYHGAAGGQGRTGLAGDHRRREVPRSDGGGYTDRLLEHHQALVDLVTGDHVAIHALGLFAEPLQKGSGISDFATGLG